MESALRERERERGGGEREKEGRKEKHAQVRYAPPKKHEFVMPK